MYDENYRFKQLTTDLAIWESRPVVGSSRNRNEGELISSKAIDVLLRSPPEIPRLITVPTLKYYLGSKVIT